MLDKWQRKTDKCASVIIISIYLLWLVISATQHVGACGWSFSLFPWSFTRHNYKNHFSTISPFRFNQSTDSEPVWLMRSLLTLISGQYLAESSMATLTWMSVALRGSRQRRQVMDIFPRADGWRHIHPDLIIHGNGKGLRSSSLHFHAGDTETNGRQERDQISPLPSPSPSSLHLPLQHSSSGCHTLLPLLPSPIKRLLWQIESDV